MGLSFAFYIPDLEVKKLGAWNTNKHPQESPQKTRSLQPKDQEKESLARKKALDSNRSTPARHDRISYSPNPAPTSKGRVGAWTPTLGRLSLGGGSNASAAWCQRGSKERRAFYTPTQSYLTLASAESIWELYLHPYLTVKKGPLPAKWVMSEEVHWRDHSEVMSVVEAFLEPELRSFPSRNEDFIHRVSGYPAPGREAAPILPLPKLCQRKYTKTRFK